jgi:hypothetical protein
LLIVLTAFPRNFARFGFFCHKSYDDKYISRISFISILLALSDGFRGGELLTAVQKNWPPSVLRKIPRIEHLRFYLKPLRQFTLLSDFDTKKLQLQFLQSLIEDTSSFYVLIAPFTKPGRHRPILYSHFHMDDSCALCPICITCNYLFHRLQINSRPLVKSDFLYVFKGRGDNFIPFTSPIFTSALQKICEALNFVRVTLHNFKIGVLTEL